MEREVEVNGGKEENRSHRGVMRSDSKRAGNMVKALGMVRGVGEAWCV